jgi:hypothetical protein
MARGDGRRIDTFAISHEGKKHTCFLYMVQPPRPGAPTRFRGECPGLELSLSHYEHPETRARTPYTDIDPLRKDLEKEVKAAATVVWEDWLYLDLGGSFDEVDWASSALYAEPNVSLRLTVRPVQLTGSREGGDERYRWGHLQRTTPTSHAIHKGQPEVTGKDHVDKNDTLERSHLVPDTPENRRALERLVGDLQSHCTGLAKALDAGQLAESLRALAGRPAAKKKGG